MATDGCVSSRLLHECDGEDACGFYGLPHVMCVPIPPYAAHRAPDTTLTVEGEGGSQGTPPQDELHRAAAPKASG